MTEFKGGSGDATRALQLLKEREQRKVTLEAEKRRVEEDNVRRGMNIGNKFAKTVDSVEQLLKADTIGLVTLDEFKGKRERAELEREKQVAAAVARATAEDAAREKSRQERAAARKKQPSALSFDMDDGDDDEEEEEEEEAQEQEGEQQAQAEGKDQEGGGANSEAKGDGAGKRKAETESGLSTKRSRFGKNPLVDTDFLPDRDREDMERLEREKLRQEWVEKQQKMKQENIQVTFSYWDGSGHRKSVVVKKGNTIEEFLSIAMTKLREEFKELRNASVDSLMYVKEDLILPMHYTFYEFIVNKARGKSGPLFCFDVHEDVRMVGDASLETDESHAGKVLERSWYERNKHIFPASRWEPYDPEKSYAKYTVK